MNKKLISLISLPLIVVSSCSYFNKTKIGGNIDSFLFGNNNYLLATTEAIKNNLKASNGFILYLTNEDCLSCKEFAPIMDKYILSSNINTYKIDVYKNAVEFQNLLDEVGDKIFNKNDNGYDISTPGVYVINDKNEVDNVKYSSYMKKEASFFNYMNRYEASNVYFTTGDISNKNFVNKEFAYIYFDFNNLDNLNLYETKLKDYALISSRKVIISNYPKDNMLHLTLSGKSTKGWYSRKEFIVTNETSEEIIKQIL